MLDALKRHYPEYLMEAALLGAFMVAACAFSVLLFHPASVVARSWPDPAARRVLMGLAMGATAVGLLYSPWGKQSGGHLNPAVTLTFYRMGKVAGFDALWYMVAQFFGATTGVALAFAVLGPRLADPGVRYAVTMPGPYGTAAAFVAEFAISAVLMSIILAMTNRSRLAGYTGLVAGVMVALYISLESPISGMSMNPARTFGSALWAASWRAWWIYFTEPPLGMLVALWLRRRAGRSLAACAKLHHDNDTRCVFCEYQAQRAVRPPA